jgi:hypothetical protein
MGLLKIKFMKNVIFILLIILSFLKVNGQSAKKLLLTRQQATEFSLNSYKTEDISVETYEVIPTWNEAYLRMGVKHHLSIDPSMYLDVENTASGEVDIIFFSDTIRGDVSSIIPYDLFETSIDSAYFKYMKAPTVEWRNYYRAIESKNNVDSVTFSGIINSDQVDLQDENGKYVMMGIISDNFFLLEVNGDSVLYYEETKATTYSFSYLHIIKVPIENGNNVFTFYQKNEDLAQSIGVTLWNNTADELLYNDPVLLHDEWDVLFSTEDIIGDSTYLCPFGYVSDLEEGVCWKIDDLEDYEAGDGIYISIYNIPEEIRTNPSNWFIDYGDGDSESGTGLKDEFIHNYTNTGTYTLYYEVESIYGRKARGITEFTFN